MRPRYDDREPQVEPPATEEPLVDIDVTPPQPNEPRAGSRPRRKRLSDMETQASDAEPQPQPQAKPQYRRQLATSETCPGELQSEPRRPCPVDVTPASEGPELRLRAGRPRLTVALSSDSVPGLQNILDPPCSAGNMTASGQANVEPLVTEMRARQSFSLALVGGLAAAAVGAIAWTLTPVATSHQTSWMAVGVGLLVGVAVRVLGRGIDKSFGYLGATLSIFGCLLGNLLSVCTIVAGQENLSTPAVLAHVFSNPVLIPTALIATFRSMDLLFYGIAVYEGYRLSFRRVAEA
jgi:hypothetical protein